MIVPIATKFFHDAQYSVVGCDLTCWRGCPRAKLGEVRCEMNPTYWRRCRRLLGIVLCAAFAFGGTFSDCSCQYGGTTVTKTSDNNNNPNANP